MCSSKGSCQFVLGPNGFAFQLFLGKIYVGSLYFHQVPNNRQFKLRNPGFNIPIFSFHEGAPNYLLLKPMVANLWQRTWMYEWSLVIGPKPN